MITNVFLVCVFDIYQERGSVVVGIPINYFTVERAEKVSCFVVDRPNVVVFNHYMSTEPVLEILGCLGGQNDWLATAGIEQKLTVGSLSALSL